MLIPKNKPIRDKKHLEFIRSLPCVTCGASPKSDPSHISIGNGKAMGRKVADNFTVPQCRVCHSKVHQSGEITFWDRFGGAEDASKLANVLYLVSGDYLEATREIILWKHRDR